MLINTLNLTFKEVIKTKYDVKPKKHAARKTPVSVVVIFMMQNYS